MIKVLLREALDRCEAQTGRRFTYEALAAETGISLATLQSLGSRAGYNTTLHTIEKLCRALGCQPGDLLELTNDSPLGKSP
jgi:DNA-binding Xre family transcriptional regulator